MFFLAAADVCGKCNGVLGINNGIPTQLVSIVSLVYKVIQIGVPLILIFVGMLDMGKAITQQKEDEIKKAQSLLVKKAIAAALVFLMFGIVKLVIGVVNNNDQGTLNFVDCLLTGNNSVTQDNSENNCTLTHDDCGDGTSLNVDNCVCE